jgi:magnesium chelatase family protein
VLASVTTFAVYGIDSKPVTVEVDIRERGLPAFTIVGLPDRAVRESRERVRAALKNSGFDFPGGRITVNLARPDRRSIWRWRSGSSAPAARYLTARPRAALSAAKRL